jgi:tetratricopeptide (TPR) repeat protein
MGKRKEIILLFFVFLTVLFNISAHGSAEEAFAQNLFKNKEYKSAVLEYERLIFHFPDSAHQPLWYYRLGLCKANQAEYGRAMNDLSLVAHDSPWADSARLLAAECALHLDNPVQADSILKGVMLEKSPLIKGYANFLLEEYKSVKEHYKSVDQDNPYFYKIKTISFIADSILKFKNKHYLPAGFLSLVPGLGHVYTKQYGDGLFSAIMVGLFGACTAYYHYHDAKERVIVFGTLTGLFYTGSIYGALVSVKLFNQKGRERLKDRARKVYKEQ